MNRNVTLLGLALAVGAFMPREVAAQGGTQQQGSAVVRRGVGTLGQNFPNPFNPETTIPFSVGDAPICADSGKQHRVTLRIYNTLAREVAVPVLKGGTSGVSGGQPIDAIMIPCGQYEAYWDGKMRGTGRDAPSGVYSYVLQIDGVPLAKKMIVVK
jgi:hypothetical protein